MSELKYKVGDIVYSKTWQRDVIIIDILPDGVYKVGDKHGLGWFKENEDNLLKEKITLPTDSQLFKQEISLPEGHQFVDEHGNVINATKIVLEKKKKEYPKTYDECCEILEDVADCSLSCFACGVLNNLQKLLLCRDAYWKLAGEKMGLKKNWEPDWEDNTPKFSIRVVENALSNITQTSVSYVLTFPTAEMRDAFYDNFKEEIEICKSLL